MARNLTSSGKLAMKAAELFVREMSNAAFTFSSPAGTTTVTTIRETYAVAVDCTCLGSPLNKRPEPVASAALISSIVALLPRSAGFAALNAASPTDFSEEKESGTEAIFAKPRRSRTPGRIVPLASSSTLAGTPPSVTVSSIDAPGDALGVRLDDGVRAAVLEMEGVIDAVVMGEGVGDALGDGAENRTARAKSRDGVAIEGGAMTAKRLFSWRAFLSRGHTHVLQPLPPPVVPFLSSSPATFSGRSGRPPATQPLAMYSTVVPIPVLVRTAQVVASNFV